MPSQMFILLLERLKKGCPQVASELNSDSADETKEQP